MHTKQAAGKVYIATDSQAIPVKCTVHTQKGLANICMYVCMYVPFRLVWCITTKDLQELSVSHRVFALSKVYTGRTQPHAAWVWRHM